MTSQQLIIYRAGSLTRAFNPLVAKFACETGIQVKDNPMGSVDAARQITAGGKPCDLYAPADYLDIDMFLKPAGYAAFNIVFAQGKMVLLYSVTSLAGKKLPPLVSPGGPPFDPPASVPSAVENWYEILTMPGVVIGGGHPYLDPGAYRLDLIFQLAAEYYGKPALHNDLLQHVTIPGPVRAGATLGKQIDFQLIYEHNARAMAADNPDIRYANLPDKINLSDPTMDVWYRQHASIVLPGLGSPGAARSVAIPAARVAWGITILKNAPNQAGAVKFLKMLLGRDGAALLEANGPSPLSPAVVSSKDYRHLPEALRPLVQQKAASQ
jgi:molybdate/tungstate transport system substrate-binding protein